LFPPRIPLSSRNFTYAFIPLNFLRGLLGKYGMCLHPHFATPDLTAPDPNDAIPSNIDPSTISYICRSSASLVFSVSNPRIWIAKTADDGAAISFHLVLYPEASPISRGWTATETILIHQQNRRPVREGTRWDARVPGGTRRYPVGYHCLGNLYL